MGSLKCVAALFVLLWLPSACSSDSGEQAGDAPGSPAPDCDARLARVASVTLGITSADTTDPTISRDFGNHVWADPAGNAAHKLFVFLGGTGGFPEVYRTITATAAAAGYHAVGLAYHNVDQVIGVCSGSADSDCTKLVRWEIISGEDVSPLVSVDRANSIENRLAKFLVAQGWSEYLDGESPRWSAITMAGHSQGAGHSMMLGQRYALHRVVAIAGPPDDADWTSDPSATAKERYWGFIHVGDLSLPPVEMHWENLGIVGVPTDIDAVSPPFDGSQRLLTSARVDAPHFSVAVDNMFPADPAELRRMQEAWCYMLGP